jgi:hypothetical protein
MVIFCRAFKNEETHFKEGGSKEKDREAFEIAEKSHKRSAYSCLGWTFSLLAVAAVADAVQVLAIFALQHCHKEPLLGLYWPVWTLLGLGSSIAMLGVLLNQVYGLQEHELPPFGTALGTPVLVVCSVGHYILTLFQAWRNKRNKGSDTALTE